MDGWIKLYRQIQDNVLWQEKPFDKRSAWIDLLLLANHADKKILIDNQIVTIARGQYHTSIMKLADRWGWNRKTVSSFLNLLESDEMLDQERTTRGTTLTIVNYGFFQSDGTTERTAERTTMGQPNGQLRDSRADTNKNIKNDKERKNEKNNRANFVPPTIEEVTAYCQERNNGINPQTFIDFYQSKGWFIGKNKMKDWKAAVRTWEQNRKDQPKEKSPGYKQFEQREYDFTDLEKQLLGN